MMVKAVGIDPDKMTSPLHEGSRFIVPEKWAEQPMFDGRWAKPIAALGSGLGPFTGKPVLRVLKDLAQITEEVVQLFTERLSKSDTFSAPAKDDVAVESVEPRKGPTPIAEFIFGDPLK